MTLFSSRQSAHGGEVLETARRLGMLPEDILDFSNNADSLATPLASELLAGLNYPFSYYPDTDCRELCQALSDHEAVQPQDIIVGNGSSELIYLTLKTLRPARVLLVGPIFLEYPRACASLNIPYALHALDPAEDFQLSPEELYVVLDSLAGGRYDMLIICSPNNPTGQAYELVERLLQEAPCRTVILDAAYREFTYATQAFATHSHARLSRQAQRGSDLISLHSFTKHFGVPGLRLGYAMGPSPIIHEMHKGRAPWMVSRYAELAGLTLLENIHDFRALRKDTPQRRETFAEALLSTGLFARIPPSQCNFLLCKLHQAHEAKALQSWLSNRGVLVRNCDTIPGMSPGYLRLQVRSDADNARLTEELAGWILSEERRECVGG